MRSQLIIRFDYGHIVPWVRRIDDARVAIAGPDALCLRTPVDVHGEELTTVSDFVVAPGDRVPFVLTWFPSHEAIPEPVDADVALAETESFWLELGERRPAPWAAPRGHPSVAAGAQGAHLCPNRRHRGLTDDVTAGANRRCPQLGLPLLLAPRRQPDPAWRCSAPATAMRHRPGASGSCVRVAGDPGDVQIMYGVAGERRLEERTLDWLPGFAEFASGTSGQRRVAPAPARHVRRGAGRGLSDARAGHRGLGVRMGAGQDDSWPGSPTIGRMRMPASGKSAGRYGTSRTRR